VETSGAAAGTQGRSSAPGNSFLTKAPSIALPKGGGAIRGIDEKFTANPVTGTAGMSVPIATSPGRSGFGPQLSLSYDSGAGNGPFGLGWSLSLPSITRKTDKGLPRYQDAEESDVFILSGAEDLVPIPRPADATDPAGYRVQRYRPRIEGLFARVERWTAEGTAETHWRSISRDNVTTLFGVDNDSRLFDPADPNPEQPTRIFSWLICQRYDDKGNAIEFEYAREDDRGLDLSQANERNRTAKTRAANRYLKRIRYGNTESRLLPAFANTRWLFEVVFDYGEGHFEAEPVTADGRQTVHARRNGTGAWLRRPDAFSSYRAGFEVRTYRLCERVLMLHHFPELGVDDYLVSSTEFTYDRGPVASFLTSVTQSGYIAWPDAANPTDLFLQRSLPPLEFEYTKALFSSDVRTLDREAFDNLPGGLDGSRYQWVDLDGEGLSGILTEQAATWYYRRNLGEGHFGPQERVARVPSGIHLNTGGQQLLDVSGSGQLALAEFGGPTPGLYQRTSNEDWEPFTPFRSLPRIDWTDPNLRFVDLTGDGLADVLITEDVAFRWHPSLAEDGFGPEVRRGRSQDEEKGPRLVFADGTESIYLADLSGDGLTDLVRIRNGEVSYWPNLGYGRFGARVTMDRSPRFDHPDLFDQRQVRLADIDGSGTADLIYLRRGQVTIYRNLSGNAWGEPETLTGFPVVDDLSSVVAVDLLGTGTACLVWSSPLPRDIHRPLRFVELMADGKPHLLRTIRNNLGAATRVDYTPSTAFYLADRKAGRPWITKLPFPVHCVTRVTVTDRWRGATFATTYSYHHGYFDAAEREFRGFGRVETVDVESYGTFAAANIDSPYVTSDRTLYQPPVKTITWFHTGAAVDRHRILTQFATEYFPNAVAGLRTDVAIDGVFREKALREPDLESQDLSADEWREALRACKGMMLRQEVYELDVERLEATGGHVAVRLFSAASHNCNIRRLQPRAGNQPAVFLVTEGEALTYHYELDLRASAAPAALAPDPRIAHNLNLSFDELGNVRQAITVGYPRVRQHADTALDTSARSLIRNVQADLLVAYTETHFTNDVPQDIASGVTVDHYRLRVPSEVLTYELTGFTPGLGRYFDIDELREYALSTTIPGQGTLPVASRQYHELPQGTAAAKRLVEHVRTLFFKDDLSDYLPAGQLGRLGLVYEQYKLALTSDLLDNVFTNGQLDEVVDGGGTARDRLDDWRASGYFSGTDATARFGTQAAGQYWIRSGVAGFAPDAADRFYLPEQYTDPFGGRTTLEYDGYDIFVTSSTDALGNTTRVTRFDYRVLAPAEMEDVNRNRHEAYFDALGRVIAVALAGKGNEGDNLTGYDDAFANPEVSDVRQYFKPGPLTIVEARDRFGPVLGNATTRYLYHFGDAIGAGGAHRWMERPAGACAIVRERHVGALATGDPPSPVQVAFECSDGTGTVLMKRAQAEPAQAGGSLRWIVSGKTVLNNKGKPVKQYEPYFSESPGCCAEGDAQEEVGVTPLMYYDAVGRLVRTELPDGTYTKVDFSPWHVTEYDGNDTAYDPDAERQSDWYKRRKNPAHPRFAEFDTPENARAADSVELHANTPARTILDSLGRAVISITHNRYAEAAGLQDERYLTFTRLDAEGKALWIRDAQGNLVMQHITPARAHDAAGENVPAGTTPCYDIAGNLLYQHSMDAGDRWVFMDAAGQSMLAWDANDRTLDDGSTVAERRILHIRYDALHRPLEHWLVTNDTPALIEAFEYVNTNDFRSAAGAIDPTTLATAQARNLVGQSKRHYDPSGLATIERVDFKGAIEEVTRTLVAHVRAAVVDWSVADREALLEPETFIHIVEHDAVGRETTLYDWHRDVPGQPGTSARVAVHVSEYNPRGVLASKTIHVRASKQAGPGGLPRFVPDTAARRNVRAIAGVTWDAKGQRLSLVLGNGTTTRYTYDPETFRLVHLFTRRSNAFAGDCAGSPDAARPARPCGVQNLHYTYDAVGNVTEIEDDAQPTIWFANQQVEPNCRYVYDALYRLIEATGRENAEATQAPSHDEGPWQQAEMPSPDSTRTYRQRYRYDRVGNITRMRHIAEVLPGMPDGGWTREYAYAYDDTTQPASNRLWQTWLGGARTQAITYRHDPHGNLRNLASTAPGLDVRWDWRDMIRALDLQGGGNAFYNYGIDRQRSRKRLERNGNGTEDRIYLGGYELYRRRDAAGTAIEEIETLHAFEGDRRVLMVDDVITAIAPAVARTVFRYQYSNHLGSVAVELDDTARVISYEEFHPYGTTAYRLMNSAVEAPRKRYRYTGMERDEESGLNCHGARYLSTTLGRWVSPDPSGIADDVNRFCYVGGNPVGFVDLTGHAKLKWQYVAAGFGLAVVGIAVGVAIVSTGGLLAAPIAGAVGLSEASIATLGGATILTMGTLGAVELGKEVGEIATEREYGTMRELTDEEYSMKVGAFFPNAVANLLGMKGLKGGIGPGGTGGEGVMSLMLKPAPAMAVSGVSGLVSDVGQKPVLQAMSSAEGGGGGKAPKKDSTADGKPAEKRTPPDKAQFNKDEAKDAAHERKRLDQGDDAVLEQIELWVEKSDASGRYLEKTDRIVDFAIQPKQILKESTTPTQILETGMSSQGKPQGKLAQMLQTMKIFQEAKENQSRVHGWSQKSGKYVGDVTDWQQLYSKYLHWNWKKGFDPAEWAHGTPKPPPPKKTVAPKKKK
jgi:RHS repeat-associated protein